MPLTSQFAGKIGNITSDFSRNFLKKYRNSRLYKEQDSNIQNNRIHNSNNHPYNTTVIPGYFSFPEPTFSNKTEQVGKLENPERLQLLFPIEIPDNVKSSKYVHNSSASSLYSFEENGFGNTFVQRRCSM